MGGVPQTGRSTETPPLRSGNSAHRPCKAVRDAATVCTPLVSYGIHVADSPDVVNPEDRDRSVQGGAVREISVVGVDVACGLWQNHNSKT